jgi:hypothetical protein
MRIAAIVGVDEGLTTATDGDATAASTEGVAVAVA